MRSFNDEKIYIIAGNKYICGIAPYYINFEHPPLAKYLIGIFNSMHIRHFLPVLCIAVSTYLAYLITSCLTNSKYSVLYIPLVLSDALIINSLFFCMLDPVALLFTIGVLYTLVKYISLDKYGHGNNWLYIAGILTGLAIASKWSCLYVLMPALLIFLIYCNVKIKNIKRLSLFFILASITYSMTFLVDFIYGGFNLFIEHHIKMINYMGHRHMPTLPMFLNGLFTLLCKINLWHHRGIEYLTIWINDTSINYNLTYINVNTLLIEFEP